MLTVKILFWEWLRLKTFSSWFILVLFILLFLFPVFQIGIQKTASIFLITNTNTISRELYANDSETLIRNVIEWENRNIENIYGRPRILQFAVFLRRDGWPCFKIDSLSSVPWIYFNRCGACGEYSYVFQALTAADNLTAISVQNTGEDHAWNEVLINGSWIGVDATFGEKGFNVSPDFYEKEWHKNLSYVYGVFSNYSKVDLTKKYTRTGKLIVNVSRYGQPVSAKVMIHSNSIYPNQETGLDCITDKRGICEFEVGGTNYTIIAITLNLFVLSDSKNVVVIENQTTRLALSPTNFDLVNSIPIDLQWTISLLAAILLWIFVGLTQAIIITKITLRK